VADGLAADASQFVTDSRLMTRKRWICRGVIIVSLLAAVSWSSAQPARALDTDQARAHVDATIESIFQLVQANLPRAETAEALRSIFEEKTALSQLAQFTAGRNWRQMSGEEQARFTETFSKYVAFVYAGHFREFKGDIDDLRAVISIKGTEDVGAKGVLVRSELSPTRQARVSVDWLISDRSGKIAISDLIVEGISLAVTQREIISAMLEARGGDVDKLIADLEEQQLKAGP
jgi:phospholipid transport system substrate-binding protein